MNTVTIQWRPTREKFALQADDVEGLLGTMERAFGSAPFRLNIDSIPRLEGMAASRRVGDQDNPYRELIRAVQSQSEIEVWPEY